MDKKTVEAVDLHGKRVLMRVDFNVPIDDGKITDDTRIQAALPSIKYILEKGASLILMSHLGRPKGKRDESFSLAPIAEHLGTLISAPVKMAPDTVGEKVREMAESLQAGEILLLENTRFYPEEEGKKCTEEEQEKFAQELASYGDIYVNDAFGTAHRSHASTAVVAKFMPVKVAGFLMEKELKYLGRALENPEHPFIAIIGGAKISGKLEVLHSLMQRVDTILIGGGMAYTFLKAQGHEIGNSLVEDDLLETAKETLKQAEKSNTKFLLPQDNVIADEFDASASTNIVGQDIPADWMALDIGPNTIQQYRQEIAGAKMIVWNGPMGCFEMEPFAKGTMEICQAVAESGATSIIGGGDSVSAVNKSGLASKMTHISTGGGASLEFLEGKMLPGIAALDNA